MHVKDEMRNIEYETLQVQTPTNTIEPATTIFFYKHALHQPARCDFERLVRTLLFDNDQSLLYYNKSVIAHLIRLHVSLAMICCKLTLGDAVFMVVAASD